MPIPGSSRHPTRIVPLAFLATIIAGTVLLMLPAATATGETTSFTDAAFTAASAVTVTGLTVYDTANHWSSLGHVVILLLVQVGGLGIMTAATTLILLVNRRLGVRSRLIAQTEHKALSLGNAREVITRVAALFVAFETVFAVVLALRFIAGYDYPVGRAAWFGLFHSVSAFNNAGFALYSDSLEGFVRDAWICVPITVAVIIGGLGFPVLMEIYRERHQVWAWSVTTRLTLWVTGVLFLFGIVFFTVAEWTNDATFGPLSAPHKLLAGFVTGVMPRSGGFAVVPTSELGNDSWLVMDALMFIGAGSAGTSGGIKVTTFAVLAFVMLAEVRGEPDVTVTTRRIPYDVQRQALTVALSAVALVSVGTLILREMTSFSLDRVLFEVVSAFGTTGLSTGITAELPDPGKWLLMVLMFVGRVGTITAAAALALHGRARLYRLPEERVIVG
jgi:trk system potassium uptake protein